MGCKINQTDSVLGTLGMCHYKNLRLNMKLEASANTTATCINISPELGEDQKEILTKESERRLGLVLDMFTKCFANYANIQDSPQTEPFLDHFTHALYLQVSYSHAHTHTHTHARTRVRAHTHTHTHTHIHTRTLSRSRLRALSLSPSLSLSFPHTHTHARRTQMCLLNMDRFCCYRLRTNMLKHSNWKPMQKEEGEEEEEEEELILQALQLPAPCLTETSSHLLRV